MVFLEGDPPPAPLLVLLVIRPDGTTTHVQAEVALTDWSLSYEDFSDRYLRPATAAVRNSIIGMVPA